ncbi:MAG: hypothetical protein ETSY1_28420 [Candidatus Entotheonella factor]|uniref:Uncharacterized protein n=1 Tax=Entotheonella factor TaxID=1429438 RepID=W4LF70_ENTF1|nr:hypothetical protein [Candidatus Entotheonella palauensis]ETW95986.1 MAG: hypothetical protein ETSY1_28420 [Candidatus Entotheonella factor]
MTVLGHPCPIAIAFLDPISPSHQGEPLGTHFALTILLYKRVELKTARHRLRQR